MRERGGQRREWGSAVARARRGRVIALLTGVVAFAVGWQAGGGDSVPGDRPDNSQATGAEDASSRDPLARGRYLATIGVCEACHTPPKVPETPDPSDPAQVARERQFRTDPDWVRYLDDTRRNAGGVPFIIRISDTQGGVVYSRNITPDPETGIGTWSVDDIVKALRTGETPDGRVLFLFPPHTFYQNLADSDARALAMFLKSQPPIRHRIPDRELPFPPEPAPPVPHPVDPPEGPTTTRGEYLVSALVGCVECHSHHEDGELQKFTGGDPQDALTGVFRLGPDLPLRVQEKGLATFPYPGYAVLYAGNLTEFGQDGPGRDVRVQQLVRTIRTGIAVAPDKYGRPRPLEHVMLWQFYSQMSDQDATAIARMIKGLRYVPHHVPEEPIRFGEDWRAAFEQVFGEPPSPHDEQLFGK